MDLGLIVGAYGAVLSSILAIRGYFKDKTRWKIEIDDTWFIKQEYNTNIVFSISLTNNSNKRHSINKCWLEVQIKDTTINLKAFDFKPEYFEQYETKKLSYSFYLEKSIDIEFAIAKNYSNIKEALKKCGLNCSLFLTDNNNKKIKQQNFVREDGFWQKFK